MKKQLIFLGFSMALTLISCIEDPPPPNRPLFVKIYLLGDLSGTYLSAEKLVSDYVVRIANFFLDRKYSVRLLTTHVSQPQINPASLVLNPFTGKLDQFSLEYKDQVTAKLEQDSSNTTATQSFNIQFKQRFTDFTFTKDNNYSYIETHLNGLTNFLHGDSTTLRIGVISTDFINDTPTQKADFVDASYIELLNEAIASGGKLYVITNTPRKGTPLENLNATFLTSWSDFLFTIESEYGLKQTVSK